MSVGVPTVIIHFSDLFLQVNSMRKCNCSYARDFYQLFSSLRRTGIVFLRTEVPVWFIPVQGCAGMAYRLIPSLTNSITHRSALNWPMSYRVC